MRLSDMDRAELLGSAVNALLAHGTTRRAKFLLYGQDFTARFDWPGVVSVYTRYEYKLVVASLPGQPKVPDLRSTASAAIQ